MNWNPETLRYEKCANPQPDRFRELRLRKMQKIAMNIRVVLRAAKVYAPNPEARAKATRTIELFNRVLGKPSLADRAKAMALVATGAVESARLAIHWSCLSFVDTFKLWTEGVYDAEESSSLPAGAAA
jgi:hypothetical protein